MTEAFTSRPRSRVCSRLPRPSTSSGERTHLPSYIISSHRRTVPAVKCSPRLLIIQTYSEIERRVVVENEFCLGSFGGSPTITDRTTRHKKSSIICDGWHSRPRSVGGNAVHLSIFRVCWNTAGLRWRGSSQANMGESENVTHPGRLSICVEWNDLYFLMVNLKEIRTGFGSLFGFHDQEFMFRNARN